MQGAATRRKVSDEEPCSTNFSWRWRAKNANYNKVYFDLKSIIVRNGLKVMSRSEHSTMGRKGTETTQKLSINRTHSCAAQCARGNEIHFLWFSKKKEEGGEYLGWLCMFYGSAKQT